MSEASSAARPGLRQSNMSSSRYPDETYASGSGSGPNAPGEQKKRKAPASITLNACTTCKKARAKVMERRIPSILVTHILTDISGKYSAMEQFQHAEDASIADRPHDANMNRTSKWSSGIWSVRSRIYKRKTIM